MTGNIASALIALLLVSAASPAQTSRSTNLPDKTNVMQPAAMRNTLGHFSIEADDVDRAKHFYERVFGWQIVPWGPPNYYLINPDARVSGDIRERREPRTGTGTRGFECTIGVDDLRAVTAAVLANGGKIDAPEFRLEGVGNLAYFVDTEGNRFGAMKYDNK